MHEQPSPSVRCAQRAILRAHYASPPRQTANPPAGRSLPGVRRTTGAAVSEAISITGRASTATREAGLGGWCSLKAPAAAGRRPHEADGAAAACVNLRVAHSVDATAGLLGSPILWRACNCTTRRSDPVTLLIVALRRTLSKVTVLNCSTVRRLEMLLVMSTQSL